ncbi:hypothetical protein LTR66_001548 [Elasticomyces elasticus]|nr:hypothetical protein LTR50_004913 [Elasticomyces elasticus]KAK4999399.1 hypothetical protein LTR66_001548 [Elasticomyces elasticus]
MPNAFSERSGPQTGTRLPSKSTDGVESSGGQLIRPASRAELSVTAASMTPTLRSRTSVVLAPMSAANAYNENTTPSTQGITIAVTLRNGTSSATTPVTSPVHARPANPARHRAIGDQFIAEQNKALQRHTNYLPANFLEAMARRMDDEFDGEIFDKDECQKHYNESE